MTNLVSYILPERQKNSQDRILKHSSPLEPTHDKLLNWPFGSCISLQSLINSGLQGYQRTAWLTSPRKCQLLKHLHGQSAGLC